ncbi:MAG: sigma-70 family RNA polymerase sigma factor, partial [Nitrospirae bacterium]|nr:sigma-70 family RNA polymerase sigma factor [Nitrospirota bacterium]
NYRGLIVGFALKRGLSESEAEDVVQETFVAVAKGIGEFRYDPQKCAFKTWLMNLTSRRVADHFRKASRGGTSSLDSQDAARSPLLNSVPDPNVSELTRQWDEEWNKNLVEAALEHLKQQVDPKQFGVFYLHVVREQPPGQVAKSLGVSVAYVYLDGRHGEEADLRWAEATQVAQAGGTRPCYGNCQASFARVLI